MAADQPVLTLGFDDRTVHQSGLRAERLKALEMLVDRTHAEVAAAGQRDLCLAVLAQQRAQEVIGRTHAAHQLGGGRAGSDMHRVDIEGGFIDPSDLGAHLLQDLADKRHVADVRDILDLTRLVTENNGRNDRHCRVFGTADVYFAE